MRGKLDELSFPFMFLGNSGAAWRAESFTDDAGLAKDIMEYPQCNCVCVLPGNGVEIGERSTMFAYSLAASYGAAMANGRTWSSRMGAQQNIEVRKFPGAGNPDPDAINVLNAAAEMKH